MATLSVGGSPVASTKVARFMGGNWLPYSAGQPFKYPFFVRVCIHSWYRSKLIEDTFLESHT